MNTPEISVVVPAFNESANLEPLVSRLLGGFRSVSCTCEILIVNDGSTDGTLEAAAALESQHPEVRAIHFARNFGKEAALAAGMDAALGRATLFMDADLQHPPELVQQMVLAWRRGAQVVNAVKRHRSAEPLLYRWCARLFNHSMSTALRSNMAGASDYKLLDRCVIQALLDCPERVRFFRGLVAWVGFRQERLEFDVPDRHAGQSSWSSWALLRYTLRNLLAFSSAPLYWVAATGFIMAVLSFAMLMQTLYNYFIAGAAVGFTTVIALQVMLGGMVLSALGVMAAYMALIYEEIKRRPLYVVNRPGDNTSSRNGP
jgi:dolichol-phosphate mannosyltransferase